MLVFFKVDLVDDLCVVIGDLDIGVGGIVVLYGFDFVNVFVDFKF